MALNQMNESLYTCSIGTIRMSIRNMGTGTRDGTAGPIIITDTLPDAFAYVGYAGEGWTCSTVGQVFTCRYPATLGPDAETFVNVTVFVSEAAYPTINNIAAVSTLYDGNPHNNVQDKPYTVYRGSGSCGPGNATPTPLLPPGAPTPTPVATQIVSGGSLSFNGGRTAAAGSSILLKAKIRKMTGPVTVVMTLPEGLNLFWASAAPSVVSGPTLTWNLPASSGLLSSTFLVRATVDAAAVPGSVLTTGLAVTSPSGTRRMSWSASVRTTTSASSTGATTLSLSASKTVSPGLTTSLKIVVKRMGNGPGILELTLPAELQHVSTTTPVGAVQPDGRIIWANLPSPGVSVSVRADVDPLAVSGKSLVVNATLTDGLGATLQKTFNTTVR